MKRRLRAPSPALVISLIALFVALGGTSLAAASYINGSRIKNHTIAEAKLTKKAIKELHGAKGARGPAGTQGPAGVNGSAVAYAHVLANGTLDTAHSKNVAQSTLARTGDYCLRITVPAVSVAATVESNVGFAIGALSSVDPTDIDLICPSGQGYNAFIAVENTSGPVSYPTFSVFN